MKDFPSVLLLLLTLFVMSCTTETEQSIPFPDSHPAHTFNSIAARGPTDTATCESHGGIEIVPTDYDILDMLDLGIFTIRQRSSGGEFLALSFAEGSGWGRLLVDEFGQPLVVTLKTCAWPVESLGGLHFR